MNIGKRFDELTPDRLACLKVVATAHINMSHDDNALLPFCDDKSTLTHPDVFNQCHEAGWLKSWHDGRLDCSFVELTTKGAQAISRAGAVGSPAPLNEND